ncbi:SidA/IucD/PvdA family monooxygenase [Streptomyces luteolifulvus]|uniref:SidA/IucD/PvdA family monooxygenase n=1 Tax=Streptomyces luteolifulvus TaxID=2615112 RepID=A0A6H9V257_9ACTN|nr:NAD(P)-binding domain-containing protein [Streptomyces luteolifulvus]KAB1146650.1 SidA/IucD/PvdA family monooxygenase [Streptomyces luteolifulvus]
MPANTGFITRHKAARGGGTHDSRRRPPTVVIGAGPYGLATAAWLSAAGTPRRVFGEPMECWHANMPTGMYLKSVPAASSISAPEPGYRLEDFRTARGLGPVGDRYPIPLDEMIAYGRWFQERRVPELERQKVRGVEAVDGLFAVTLDSGEEFPAENVVLATGLVPFAYEPPGLNALPAELVSHTSRHRDLTRFSGQRVAVLGAGQSALESAALLHEAGARPTVIVRAESVAFGSPPDSDRPADRPRPERVAKPGSPLGPGWSLLACSYGGGAFRHLPEGLRMRLLHDVLGPSGGWWLRHRVDDRFPVLCRRTVRSVGVEDGAVRLDLVDTDGRTEVLAADHLLLATGYRVDVDRLGFLAPELRREIRTFRGAPRLSSGFESSVPGLFFTGLAAAPTFGPVLRFVAGTGFAARRVARSVAARTRAHP